MPNPKSPRTGIGGPKTEEGKKRVSLNALKHGLNAESPQALELVAEACNLAFEDMLKEMRAHYKPADPVEETLVRRIARCRWRLALGEAKERLLLESVGVTGKIAYYHQEIMKFERLVDIHLHRAISTLEHKREMKTSKKRKTNSRPRSP